MTDHIRRVALAEARRRGMKRRTAQHFADGLQAGWKDWPHNYLDKRVVIAVWGPRPDYRAQRPTWLDGYRAGQAERARRFAEDARATTRLCEVP